MIDSEVANGIFDYLSTYEYASGRHVTFLLMWNALLRRGAVRALDVDDYDSAEMSLDVRHRPETGTPIENRHNGERFIALSSDVCAVLDAWLADRRPDVVDRDGRGPPLSTATGRAHLTTIQAYVALLKPSEIDMNRVLHTEGCMQHGLDELSSAEDSNRVIVRGVRRFNGRCTTVTRNLSLLLNPRMYGRRPESGSSVWQVHTVSLHLTVRHHRHWVLPRRRLRSEDPREAGHSDCIFQCIYSPVLVGRGVSESLN